MKIVVTGSSTGIGRALTRQFLKMGHHVWGLARSDQTELKDAFPDHFDFSRADVASWPAIRAAAQTIADRWNAIDALVTCAGVQGELGPSLAIDPERWSDTVRTNIDGTFFPLRALHPLLAKAERRAKVVAFSGGGATKSRPHFSAYGAAKTAIVRLIETIAAEAADAPIDLNCVAPGAINTRLTEEVIALGPTVVGPAEYEGALRQKETGGGSLEKALGLVEWLLSPASDGISGRLFAAPWDPWSTMDRHRDALARSDIYQLRRILPAERGEAWDA